jgi:hypothetical protein
MGSVSEDEAAGREWLLELLPKLHARDPSHDLLQYFTRRKEGWSWKSQKKWEEYLDRFWQRPESWKDKPGAIVRMVTDANFCLAAEKELKRLQATA